MKQFTQNGTYITLKIHKRYVYIIKQKHAKHANICAMIQKKNQKNIFKNVINGTAI